MGKDACLPAGFACARRHLINYFIPVPVQGTQFLQIFHQMGKNKCALPVLLPLLSAPETNGELKGTRQ